MIVLCLTGMPGSGKSSLASMLHRNGFASIEMGQIVRNMMEEKGITIDNHTLRNFALQLRERHGSMAVAKLTVSEIHRRKGDIAVVGIRSRKELDYFRKHLKGTMYVIAITAPPRVRYRRMVQRGRSDDFDSYKDFLWREKKEFRYGVRGAMADADFIISNAGERRTLVKNAKELAGLIRKVSSNAER